jgi:peptidyl-prolyl cis-trans isomerase C
MKRIALAAIAALASLASFAQQPPAAAPAAPQPKPIAIINGDVITTDKLDFLYDRINQQMRAQYESKGGKAAFLDNYLRKRLIVQEAIKHGFDKRPEVQAEMDAAKESALFEAYIREEVSKSVVTEAEIRKYYDAHQNEFGTPEAVNVRHIILMFNGAGPHPKSKQQAADQLERIAEDLRQSTNAFTTPEAKSHVLQTRFSEAAQKYSEDGVSSNGGSLGWVTRGKLDPKFEDMAFSLQPGTMSPVIETPFGYHLIYVDAKRPAGIKTFESVRADVRATLQAQRMADIMQAVTKLSNELRNDSKVSLFPENLH